MRFRLKAFAVLPVVMVLTGVDLRMIAILKGG
jgi:hypothetical protein